MAPGAGISPERGGGEPPPHSWTSDPPPFLRLRRKAASGQRVSGGARALQFQEERGKGEGKGEILLPFGEEGVIGAGAAPLF